MGSAVKKIGILFIITLIGALVYFFFIPYIRYMSEETLAKRIKVEASSDNKVPIEVAVGTTTIMVDLATNEGEKLQGLGGKRFLDDNEGMLFVYDEPGYHSIWMKNMFFSIDIAWLDKNFRIVDTATNVSPGSYPKSFRPEIPAHYVLEVNAGFLEAHGISSGDTVSLAGKTDL